MGKKIYVDFPESKIRVVADLCEETEPEMCEILWNTIKDQPLRMACMHTCPLVTSLTPRSVLLPAP